MQAVQGVTDIVCIHRPARVQALGEVVEHRGGFEQVGGDAVRVEQRGELQQGARQLWRVQPVGEVDGQRPGDGDGVLVLVRQRPGLGQQVA